MTNIHETFDIGLGDSYVVGNVHADNQGKMGSRCVKQDPADTFKMCTLVPRIPNSPVQKTKNTGGDGPELRKVICNTVGKYPKFTPLDAPEVLDSRIQNEEFQVLIEYKASSKDAMTFEAYWDGAVFDTYPPKIDIHLLVSKQEESGSDTAVQTIQEWVTIDKKNFMKAENIILPGQRWDVDTVPKGITVNVLTGMKVPELRTVACQTVSKYPEFSTKGTLKVLDSRIHDDQYQVLVQYVAVSKDSVSFEAYWDGKLLKSNPPQMCVSLMASFQENDDVNEAQVMKEWIAFDPDHFIKTGSIILDRNWTGNMREGIVVRAQAFVKS